MAQVVMSPLGYERLRREAYRDGPMIGNPQAISPTTFMGLPVVSSGAFPITNVCKDCDGSGSGGAESTFCGQCRGQGAIKVIGLVLENGRTTLITEPLPRQFEVHFPTDVAVPPPRMRGWSIRPWQGCDA